MVVTPKDAKVGWWYSSCCEIDLYEIQTEAELLELQEEERENASHSESWATPQCWPTRGAAVFDLAEKERHPWH